MVQTVETSRHMAATPARRRDILKALIAAVVLLLLAASLGLVFFREQFANASPKERVAVDVISGATPIFAVLFTAIFGPIAWLARKRTVERGGELLLRVKRPSLFRWTRGFLLVYGAMLCTYPVFFFLRTPSAADWVSFVSYLIFFVAVLVHDLSGMSLSHLEFRDRGILSGGQLLPWEKIRAHEWIDQRGKLRLQFSRFGFVEYRLDPAMIDEVERLLEEHASAPHTAST